MELTAKQIKELDEINHDIRATENVLGIAISHAENRFNELFKLKKEWWEEMGRIHKFDPAAAPYIVKTIGGSVVIKLRDNGGNGDGD